MASYFWVAVAGVGTGVWDNALTTHWATSSGGTAGAGPPTSSDTATFDTNSGTGTVTIASTAVCSSLAFGAANITTSFSGGVTFGAVTVTAGAFVTGSNTHSFTSLTSTSGTRTLTLTNSTINITGTTAASSVWNLASTGSLSTTLTGSTINLTGGGAENTYFFSSPILTYGTVILTAPGQWTFSAGLTFAALSYTSTTNKTDFISFNGNETISAAGSLTFAGNSSVNRAFIKSGTLGTARTITVPSTATVSITNTDFQDITMAGTFSTGATASSIGDALGNTFGWSSVQPDASVALTLGSTGTQNWSTATWTGTTNHTPLPQDDVSLGSSSTATTLTADMPRMGRNIDASGYLKTLSFASTPNTLFGNVSLGASGTFSGTQALTLAGRGAQTITSNGKTFPQAITVAAFGGTYTQQDGLSNTTTFTLNNGTWADGGNTLSGTTFVSSGALTRALNCSGTWSLSATSGTIWNVATTLTITAAPTIKLTGANSTTATFAGAGFTYGNLYWSSTTSTGTLIITGANTFADIQTDPSTARTIQLPAGVIQTVSAFSAKGSAGHLLRLTSSSPGTDATLSMASGRVNADYLNISDSAATGGAQWFAGQNSLNTTPATTTGWLFTSFLAISGGGQMLLRGVGG